MKRFLTAAALIAGLGAGTANSGVLAISDYTLVPDGTTYGSDNSNSSTEQQSTNVSTLNGGSVLPTGGTSSIYLVSTFTWGESSDAHIVLNFAASVGQNRLGVKIQDNGVVTSIGDGSDGSNDFNFAQDMAGQTVTFIAEFLYDVNRSTTNSDDTLMNVWINPTASSTASGGVAGGDFNSVWNSAGFVLLEQRIENQNTPNTAGASSIVDTVVLTNDDATWENALLAAGVPEPSSLALLGLGGLLIARRRRG